MGELDVTAFFLKLVENNAAISVALFLFYIGIKKAVEYHNVQSERLVKANAEIARVSMEKADKETELRVAKRNRQIEDMERRIRDLESEAESRFKDMESKTESRFKDIQNKQDVLEAKISRNLERIFNKLDEIKEDYAHIKALHNVQMENIGKRN